MHPFQFIPRLILLQFCRLNTVMTRIFSSSRAVLLSCCMRKTYILKYKSPNAASCCSTKKIKPGPCQQNVKKWGWSCCSHKVDDAIFLLREVAIYLPLLMTVLINIRKTSIIWIHGSKCFAKLLDIKCTFPSNQLNFFLYIPTPKFGRHSRLKQCGLVRECYNFIIFSLKTTSELLKLC